MNLITFPVRPGMQGAAVADLQDALQACLDRSAVLAGNPSERQQFSELLESERVTQKYGAVTSKLVAIFQGEQHLQAMGDVDEATANALNALLDQKTHQAEGKVGTSIGGLRVVIVDKGVGSDVQLVEATTDDGAYQATFSDSGVRQRGKALGSSGPPVARLYTQLQQLGFELPAAKVLKEKSGAANEQAIRKFQKQSGLRVTGEVSAKTVAEVGGFEW